MFIGFQTHGTTVCEHLNRLPGLVIDSCFKKKRGLKLHKMVAIHIHLT